MADPTVADVMHRDVPVVREDAPFKEVVVALAEHDVRALPVVGASGDVTGIVSASDLIEHRADAVPSRAESRWRRRGRRRKARARSAADLMTSPVVHVSPETGLPAAARIALEADVRQLPVLDGAALVGMLDRADLLADYLRSDQTIRDEIVNRVILADFCIDPACVKVLVREGIVLLSGCVDHRPVGALLVQAVRRVRGVVDVEDRLSWRHDVETSDPRQRANFPF
jgi:CBS domain-containing protein